MEHTLVTFLLDRTGSMMDCKGATIEGFNGYVDGLDKTDHGDGLIEFTHLQFDSMSLDKVCVAEPIAKVARLNHATYQPRASTPLIDACVKTINAVAKSLEARSDKPKVVVCFQTDGYENASTEHIPPRGLRQSQRRLIAQRQSAANCTMPQRTILATMLI